MDRCALFVDAGYVLADGAMAVHGTRRRESVTWDYAGLLQLLASLASEQSGLPLLRCYWYEATVEGRRSADHDVLADLPGVKLRLAKMRPGRREGVESEIHRDLATLARNRAVSDAMVVSAEEDLAQVVADVQDLGLRVSLLHIAVDGNWTISRTLRQECDDIVEIDAEHLRPYVELISGAEPQRADERDGAPLIALRPAANGHGAAPAGRAPAHAHAHAPALAGPDTGHQAPPSIYTAPVVAEYQRQAPQVSRPRPADQSVAARDDPSGEPAVAREQPARPDLQPYGGAHDVAADPRDQAAAAPDLALAGADFLSAPLDPGAVLPDALPVRQDAAPPWQEQPPQQQPPWQDAGARADQPSDLPAAWSRPPADISGYNPGAAREPMTRDPVTREQFPGEAPEGPQPVPAATGSAQIRRLPTRGTGLPAQPPGQQTAGYPPAGQPAGQPTAAQPALSVPTAAQPAVGQPAVGQHAAPVMPIGPSGGYAPGRNGVYSGPQPVLAPGGQPGGTMVSPSVGPAAPPGPAGPAGQAGFSGLPAVSLAEAVQSAHEEGQEFGVSVARDAPALWLEAVLARKPRMPSDLEARLLQGSALPIDYLLHDEVRHALRRGFWDAMERARR